MSMTHPLRRSAVLFLSLLSTFVLAVGPVVTEPLWSDEPPAAAPAAGAEAAADTFPPHVETDVGGMQARMKRTGIAIRKKLGIKFYRIAGYCCTTVAPKDVDAVAAADVAKRLVLVMERDIPDWVLRRSFEEAFANNDPDGKFPTEIDAMLDHISAQPLKKGDRVTITHVPQKGVECQIGEAPKLTVSSVDFARIVWNVYMGPRGCDAALRAGLGTELAVD